MKLPFLFYSKHLFYNHANMKIGDTGFPQMGEEGCGSLYPTCFLLTFYSTFWCFLPLLKEQGEKGKERRGKCFCIFALCLLLGLPLAFGLFLIFLKVRALNTETLYVSQKIKWNKLQTNFLKKGKLLWWKMKEREEKKLCNRREKGQKRGMSKRVKEGCKLTKKGYKLSKSGLQTNKKRAAN